MRRSRCCSEPTRRRSLVVLVAALAGVGLAGEVAPVDRIAVVVGEASVVRSVTTDTLRELYLRRQRLWPSGAPALPVNLPADDPARDAFSQRVLGRKPVDLESYWRRLYFEGVRPPPVLRTAHAVCAYVAVEPAAIGYVPAGEVDAGCRVLLVLDVARR